MRACLGMSTSRHHHYPVSSRLREALATVWQNTQPDWCPPAPKHDEGWWLITQLMAINAERAAADAGRA